jgi:hypothetical protein
MDHHPRCLVDYRDVSVLIKNLERQLLRLRRGGNGRRKLDFDSLAPFESMGGLGALSFHPHPSLFDQMLDPGSAQISQSGGEMLI